MVQVYNDPAGGSASTIGTQIRTDFHHKNALIEAKKVQFFGQLADVMNMPKHYGKKIKMFHYMPMLDERNINDQGIDAAGAVILTTEYAVRVPALINGPTIIEAAEDAFTAAHSDGDVIFITDSAQWLLLTADTAIGYDASTAGGASGTEIADSVVKGYIEADTVASGVTATVAGAVITLDMQDLVFSSAAASIVCTNVIRGSYAVQRAGNLYGSSKDIGYISSKLPTLSESGGRVNRVGYKRIELEGTFAKFGFFEEYTQASIDFDTDDELEAHKSRELVRGAAEMTEDALQADLLNAAGTIRYAGAATSNATVSGETGAACVVDYTDLSRLSIDLDNNRTPKHIKYITGSRMVDTKTISAARPLYIGSELIPTVEKMVDHFDDQAFVPIHQYGAAGNTMEGEIGAIGQWRIILVPEMMNWTGVGANEVANAGYRAENGRYNVYPMLSVGEGSFTTIGFQTDGKTVKFKIYHKKPGKDTVSAVDPYGEKGLHSIKWHYGFMALRSERIGLIKTVAEQ